jgi:hypothetical protein
LAWLVIPPAHRTRTAKPRSNDFGNGIEFIMSW